MKTTMVRYKVKAERVAEHVGLIRNVFAELKSGAPAGLKYAALTLDDGVSFVHIAGVDTADGGNPLTEQPAFKVFLDGIKDPCDEPPAAAPLTEIGAYKFFD